MPIMEKLLNQISVEHTRDRTLQLFISKIDLDHAYIQEVIQRNKPTRRICINRGKI